MRVLIKMDDLGAAPILGNLHMNAITGMNLQNHGDEDVDIFQGVHD